MRAATTRPWSPPPTGGWKLYGKLAGSSAWRDGTRLGDWDEGAGRERAGCCGGLATGGRVATIVAGPGVGPARDDATYSHYALLRSIETLFHLPLLGQPPSRPPRPSPP